ncbi:MAG: glycerophosphoryl diester phosphodiesterase [Paracoccaceae bacterium]
MSAFSTVKLAYGDAWDRRRIFVTILVVLRLGAYALIAPILAGLINLGVSLSDQAALTDQDIAMFILTPVGFVATLAVLGVLIMVEIGGFAMMAAVLRAQTPNRVQAIRMAFHAMGRRSHALLIFAVLFVLRVLVLALPFVVAGLLVAKRYLTEFDINYYLTFHPPEFIMAVGLIGAIVLVMALVLLRVLSGWALALHLVVFADVAPRAAFGQSAARMQGHRGRLQVQLLIWLVARVVLVSGLGLVAGAVLNLIPLTPGDGLRLALLLTLIVVAVWTLAGVVLAAVALGALARVLDGFFEGGKLLEPAAAAEVASLRRRLARGAVIGLGLIGFGTWSAIELLDQIKTEDHIEIIAHRGAAGSRPENTMASFEKAIEDRADWVELDVQESADGQVIVVHDSDFMKLAQVDLKVWDADQATLAGIDIGGWYDPAYSDQRVPLLRDVLAMAKGRAKVLIELKYYGHDEKLEERVALIVDDLDMADQVAVMSLKYPAVQKMQVLRPTWRTGVLAATAVGNLAGLDADFIAVNTGMVGPRLVDKIEAAGKDLYVWTVNDPLEMSQMISMGVDGLITDEPALVHQVLAVRAGLSTPERLILWLSQELGLKLNPKEYRDGQP